MLADARVLAKPACVPWRAASRRSLLVAACADCRRLGLPVVLKRAPGAAEQRRQTAQHTGWRALQGAASHGAAAAPPTSSSGEAESHALDAFLDTLKWDASGLVVAIAQARARLRAGTAFPRATSGRLALLKPLTSAQVPPRSERGHGRHYDAGVRQPGGGEAHADHGEGVRVAGWKSCTSCHQQQLRADSSPATRTQATFWTRSRQRLWTKGESSKCVLRVVGESRRASHCQFHR